MNAFELSGCSFAVVGAAVGGVYGFTNHGWIGGIVGAPSMSVAGYILGVGIVSTSFWIGIRRERSQQRRDLRDRFGAYWSDNRSSDWNELKKELKCGDERSGEIVAKFYYGVFFDIGCGFPARLSKHHWGDAALSSEPTIGDRIEARVYSFETPEKVIEFTQRDLGPRAKSNGQ